MHNQWACIVHYVTGVRNFNWRLVTVIYLQVAVRVRISVCKVDGIAVMWKFDVERKRIRTAIVVVFIRRPIWQVWCSGWSVMRVWSASIPSQKKINGKHQ